MEDETPNLETTSSSSLVLRVVGARGVSGNSADDLIPETLLLDNLRAPSGRSNGGEVKLRTPAMAKFRAGRGAGKRN